MRSSTSKTQTFKERFERFSKTSTKFNVPNTSTIQNKHILLIDDVLATGGTAQASCQLIEMLGGEIIACAFLIELGPLDGRSKLTSYPVHSLLKY